MKNGKMRGILLGVFAAVTVALVAVLLLQSRIPKPRLSYLEPHQRITPTPGMQQQDSVEAATPVPTPAHIIQTAAPVLPENAVNLLSDGVALFALDSRDTADLLVKTYFQQCAFESIEENGILLKATLVSSLSTVPADGSVEYLSFEDAMNKLNKNRSLISVQRTVERVTVDQTSEEPIQTTTDLLPLGSRLFTRLGTPSRTLVLSEIIYKDNFASSDTETLRRQISTGAALTLQNGTYTSDQEPTDREGAVGKGAGSLAFLAPIRASVTRYFGMYEGTMHYGVDYVANVGTRIYAPEAGTVIFCGDRQGYGFVIEIRHENGFVSRIANCDRVGVELYEHVNKGDVIAYLPSPENAKTESLHYELLIDGIPYNPLYYLP